MEAFILDGPRQLREAVRAADRLPATLFPETPDGSSPFTSVMLLGMGGSALSAGLIELLRHRHGATWRFDVVRDYRLPRLPDDRTLVLALSYSGETEETLAALEVALSTGANTAQAMPSRFVAASRGGRLEDAARQHSLCFVRVPERPSDFQPRFALSFMFGLAWRILVRARLLPDSTSVHELADWLECLDLESRGKELAAWLGNRIPVVYVPTEYEAGVARTWRIKFNENAKIPCIAGALPEANHNEMIAFPPLAPGATARFAFLLVDDPDGDERISLRFRLTGDLLAGYGYPVRQLCFEPAGSPIHKALGSLLLADWVTLHHARCSGIDPVSIPAIQEFKKLLRDAGR
jgi:glucose/mannose-6-phosphate isomerase